MDSEKWCKDCRYFPHRCFMSGISKKNQKNGSVYCCTFYTRKWWKFGRPK